MDSLVLLGVGGEDDDDDDDDDDDEDEEDGEEQEEAGGAPQQAASRASTSLDYEALQRAGYSGKLADLSQTGTYKRLEEEEAAAREQREEAQRLAEAEVALPAVTEESKILSREEIDKKVGYKKRFDATGEGFRAKEKRKRALGQQNRDGNWVEEEKRRLRHGAANFDS